MRSADRRRVVPYLLLPIAVGLLAGPAVAPADVAAWGAVAPATTHQWIDEQAMAVLSADPAFSADLFPTKAQVDANEGVNWSGTSEAWFDFMVGPGPDSDGATPYSWHYYNPKLPGADKGNGPRASATMFNSLVGAQAKGDVAGAGQGAAWAGHFMADMYVPFHVVGMPRAQIAQLYKDQGGSWWAWNITLPPEAFGPIELCYGCQVKDWSWLGSENFKTEVWRYLSIATPSGELPTPAPTPAAGASEVPTVGGGKTYLDWFDPWYYNGTWPATIKTSSHIAWEGAVGHDAGTVAGYDSRWRNAVPRFDSPGAGQDAQVEALAIAAATETSDNLAARALEEKDALNHAISSVATIWRASFSALRPSLRVESDTEPQVYKVTAVIDNKAAEAATGVQVRLRASGCSVEGPEQQPIAGAVTHDESISWKVKAEKPDACSLTLETIGSFTTTPDLGYAKVTKPLGTPAGLIDLVLCIDVTSSMDDDIASVKSAASAIVGRLAAKDPGYRVAVVAFRDWDEEEGLETFQDYAFSSDQSTIVGNINGLSVAGGGDEPEAVFEALMRAIDSKAIGGWRPNVSKNIILMGDAPPHSPSREGFTPAIVAKAAEDADPVVIHAVLVGNEGDFSPEAEVAFQDLADRTKGSMFRAEDADRVVEALESTIAAIQPLGPDLRPLVVGGVVTALLVLVLLLAMRRSRRRRQAAVAAAQAWNGQQASGWAAQQPTAWGGGSGWPAQQPSSWGAAAPAIGSGVGPSSPQAPVLVFGAPGDPAAPRFPLAASQVLGSAPDCTIVLADPRVSPRHAQVYATGQAFVIADVGSAGGTWVNGVQITGPTWLRPGDVVGIGPYGLTFQA